MCEQVLCVCSGLVAYADLDERALDALREFNEEGALSVLQQFKESDLSHVQVKQTVLLLFSFRPLSCAQPALRSFTEQERLPVWRDEDVPTEGEAGQ